MRYFGHRRKNRFWDTPIGMYLGTEGASGFYTDNTRISIENQLTADSMSLTTGDYGDINNQGFATQMSTNVGDTVSFKVHGDCEVIDIYRVGYYGGGLYSKKATIVNTPTSQPAAETIAGTNGATTCSGWSVTATWTIPEDAVSGMYIAVVRNAALTAFSNIIFFVREDYRRAQIVVKVSDSTWGAAYNFFNTMGDNATITSGKNLYGTGAVGALGGIETRSSQVSLDRPLVSNGTIVNHPYNYELALISFLEEQGFDVKYVTCYDLDRKRGIGKPRVLLNAGHDEYWSQPMRDNVQTLQAAGVHLVWMTSNDIFWRIRYLSSRVIECYKDTMTGPDTHVAGEPLDPTSWTGTWRDTRWVDRQPENEILGTTFRMNGIFHNTATITTNPYGDHPLWRDTAVVSGNVTLTSQIGFEANSYDPAGAMFVGRAATTLLNIDGSYADDNGQIYTGNGDLDWGIAVSRYQMTHGVSVSFGSVNWILGLSDDHQTTPTVENATTRQATVNLLKDLGASALTLDVALTDPTATTLNYYGVGLPTLPDVTDVAPSFVYSTDYTGDWAISTGYVVGDVVINLWRTYICTSAHTASGTREPGVGGTWESYWVEINPVIQPATISLSTGTLTFQAQPDSAPSAQVVTVSNTGVFPLDFTVSDNATWLTVTPTSGTDGTSLTVSCAAQSVEDTYNGTITITDPAASNSPQTVSVGYTVAAVTGEVFYTGDPTPPSTGNDATTYTLGLRFYAFNTNGEVTAIRVYRPAGADGGAVLTGYLWADNGTLLGSVAFGDTSAGGWFEATLGTPVSITADTYYVVGVSPIIEYAYEANYFTPDVFYTNGANLYVDKNNSRLIASADTFPTTGVATAFFTDVRFFAA